MPIIGVGRVGSGRDTYKKLQARASTVQVYIMLVYKDPGIASHIRKELVDLLVENGYRSMEDVAGANHETFTRGGGRRVCGTTRGGGNGQQHRSCVPLTT